MELHTDQRNARLLADDEIVELYWQRDETAIRATDAKYKKHLMAIAYNIVHDARDCEECLNDTYLGAWNAIPPARPTALRAFLTTLMRRIAINRYYSNQRGSQVP
ncbi:MAG: RNA polymerase subunit sigma-70, partial [Clostridia bacterium]|nr:RNA polymerase subunit sigma-70 [Clostridia bacterium]